MNLRLSPTLIPLSALLALTLWSASASAERPSLFERPWRWQDEHGALVGFAQWRGAPLVVTVIYTQCKLRCPMTIAKLQKLDRAFATKGQRAQFFLVTLDPRNDTPERLASYKQSRALPADSWHLLRSSEAQTQELCRFLGVRALDDDSHIDHDVKIAIFDGEGNLTGTFAGWHFDDDQAVGGVSAPLTR